VDFTWIVRELSDMSAALGGAVRRFASDITNYTRRSRQPRTALVPTRLPSPRVGRPAGPPGGRPQRHRLALPKPLKSRQPQTVLAVRRRLEDRARGGRLPWVAAVEENAERVAATIRRGLLGVRGWLGSAGTGGAR
jgi:hypothetical protein